VTEQSWTEERFLQELKGEKVEATLLSVDKDGKGNHVSGALVDWDEHYLFVQDRKRLVMVAKSAIVTMTRQPAQSGPRMAVGQ
jgi:sRNA-binding regulator protein Hfq